MATDESRQDQNETPLTTVNYMPPASNLSRPIVALKNVRYFPYRIKKIEIVEADVGKELNPKNIHYLIIFPIESRYWVLFNDSIHDDGFPLPLQDLKEINKVTTSKAVIPIKQISFIPKKGEQFIEILFTGNQHFTGTNKSYISTIKVEDDYIDEIIKLLRTLRQLQYDSSYWERHTIQLNELTFDIYPNVPFLADGEEMVWQRATFQVIDKERRIVSIDAVTNCRVFQYDYDKHQGTGILFPSLRSETVKNQHPTATTGTIGDYFVTSHNLTGIKEAATDKVLGDISFQAQDNKSIIFTEITDPETLSTAIRRLKQKHANTVVDGKVDVKSTTRETVAEVTAKCSNCQSINTPDSKFCNKCGSPLSIMCSKCGGSNPSGSLFCSKCGTKLEV